VELGRNTSCYRVNAKGRVALRTLTPVTIVRRELDTEYAAADTTSAATPQARPVN
jgi:hypothetical protein